MSYQQGLEVVQLLHQVVNGISLIFTALVVLTAIIIYKG